MDKPYFVVVPCEGIEMPLTNPKEYPLIQSVAELVQNAPQRGYGINWIIDASIVQQCIPIFNPSPDTTRVIKDHRLRMKVLQKSFGNIIAEHELHYDVGRIREDIWDNISRHGASFLEYLEQETDHWDKTHEWKNARDAALKNDRHKYDQAFDILAIHTDTRTP